MKSLFVILLVIFSLSGFSQISKVSIQASGLTCSMCSNAINKALKSLDFVEKVDANIKNSTFELTFKSGRYIDFNLLKKKVEDAGYSVANFAATVQFNNVQVKGGQPVSVGDYAFEIINAGDKVLNGLKELRFIDKGFLSGKEYKKNSSAMVVTTKGVYHTLI